MKWFVLLNILIFLSVQNSFALEVRGAEKRKMRNYQRLPMDIEDMIRAEEDPNFVQYLEERKKLQEHDEKAAEEQRQRRERWEADQEASRKSYVEWRDKQVPVEQSEAYQQHLNKQAEWESLQEKHRQEFAQHRDEQLNQQLMAKEARLKAASLDKRMPASIEQPKYPSLKKNLK